MPSGQLSVGVAVGILRVGDPFSSCKDGRYFTAWGWGKGTTLAKLSRVRVTHLRVKYA